MKLVLVKQSSLRKCAGIFLVHFPSPPPPPICNRIIMNKPISGCIRVACELWQLVDEKSTLSADFFRVGCQNVLSTDLLQVLSTSCNKSVNDKLQLAWILLVKLTSFLQLLAALAAQVDYSEAYSGKVSYLFLPSTFLLVSAYLSLYSWRRYQNLDYSFGPVSLSSIKN